LHKLRLLGQHTNFTTHKTLVPWAESLKPSPACPFVSTIRGRLTALYDRPGGPTLGADVAWVCNRASSVCQTRVFRARRGAVARQRASHLDLPNHKGVGDWSDATQLLSIALRLQLPRRTPSPLQHPVPFRASPVADREGPCDHCSDLHRFHAGGEEPWPVKWPGAVGHACHGCWFLHLKASRAPAWERCAGQRHRHENESLVTTRSQRSTRRSDSDRVALQTHAGKCGGRSLAHRAEATRL